MKGTRMAARRAAISAVALGVLAGCGHAPAGGPSGAAPAAGLAPAAPIDERPSPRSADQVAGQAVVGGLIDDELTFASTTTVIVQDGIATLHGTAFNLPAKRRAAEIALGTPGIRGVVNLIDVNPTLLPEPTVRGAVVEALATRPATRHLDVSVNVNGSVVTLSGAVATPAERERSEEVAAAVPGVRAVHNHVTIRPGPGATSPAASAADGGAAGPQLSDRQIRAAIIRAFEFDPRVLSAEIAVAVNEGRVALSGTVPTPRAARAAREDAEHTRGVAFVNDALRVVPEPRADAAIAADVRRELALDPLIFAPDVRVDVERGRVTLSGTVAADVEVFRAARIAEEVRGVQHVTNDLASSGRAFLDPADELVRRRLVTALAGDPRLADDLVTFAVQRGIVTLRGTVDTPAERSLAIGKAMQAGARDVIDRLRVERPTASRGGSHGYDGA